MHPQRTRTCTHAPTHGQVENIKPPTAHRMGAAKASACDITLYSARDSTVRFVNNYCSRLVAHRYILTALYSCSLQNEKKAKKSKKRLQYNRTARGRHRDTDEERRRKIHCTEKASGLIFHQVYDSGRETQ